MNWRWNRNRNPIQIPIQIEMEIDQVRLFGLLNFWFSIRQRRVVVVIVVVFVFLAIREMPVAECRSIKKFIDIFLSLKQAKGF